MADSKQIVLVTGASGCLGQHVVKLLQENDQSVKEIRCLDLKPYLNKLQHKTEKPMKTLIGDIRNERIVLNALEDVNCVIHCAAIMNNSGLFQDEKMMKSVNVDGTQTLINACVENNVDYFINISSVDCVLGDDAVYYGAENTTPVPTSHVLGVYSATKYEAEELVMKANGRQLANGVGKLQTLSLRPTLLYGEQDTHFVHQALKLTRERGGTLRRIDNVFIRVQPTYAGNAAWACIKAKDKIQHDQSIGGEAFFITDDTTISDPFEFLEPYIKCKGYKLSKRAFPYWLFMIFLYLSVLFIKMVHSVYPIQLPTCVTPANIKYLCNTFFFNRNKAILRLNYEPLYSNEVSQEKSIEYYKKL